jgi:hypothetical protein
VADEIEKNRQFSGEHDQALIYSSRVPGIAEVAGLKPASAAEALVIDTFLTSLGYAGESEKALSYSRHVGHYTGRSRYRKPTFTYTNAVRTVAKIVAAGLAVENRTKPGHRGRQSTLTPTPEFMSLWSLLAAEPTLRPRPSSCDRAARIPCRSNMPTVARPAKCDPP